MQQPAAISPMGMSRAAPEEIETNAATVLLTLVAGKPALWIGHLCRARNSRENAVVLSRMRDPYSTEASSSLPSCHSFHEVIKTQSGAAVIASCQSIR